MKFEIKVCKECRIFTLQQTCPSCKNTTSSPKPQRYSPIDKYGKYRREYKKIFQENG